MRLTGGVPNEERIDWEPTNSTLVCPSSTTEGSVAIGDSTFLAIIGSDTKEMNESMKE